MPLTRAEIEIKLNRDRAWLVETYSRLSEADLVRPATPSEHDPATEWNAKDHLAHLSLIELNFVRMVRRHLAGDANPVNLRADDSGRERSREEIMQMVHAMTEDWARQHHDKSLADVLAIGQRARGETLQLMSELSDAQLAETLPGAPWADGTVGGVLGVNADHGRMHWHWVKEGFRAKGLDVPEYAEGG
ncbi:MAG: DinB family protein [Dehalococcoidia bacterium]